MAVEQLTLKPGKWLVLDCGKMPSDSNCQLVMVAPEDQKDDLVDAGVKHAISKHGHQDGDELRKGVEGMCEVVEVA
jgi:hypothetical protein